MNGNCVSLELSRLDIGYLRWALCDAAKERQGWIMRYSSDPASTMTAGRMDEIIKMANGAKEMLRIIDALDAVSIDSEEDEQHKSVVLMPIQDVAMIASALRTAIMMAREEMRKPSDSQRDSSSVKIKLYSNLRIYLEGVLDSDDAQPEA